LEQTEMEQDDSDDGDENNGDTSEPTMGYALPESRTELAKSMISSVMQVCRDEGMGKHGGRRVVSGPMRQAEDYSGQQYDAPDESDDEGPAPFGSNLQASDLLTEDAIKAIADNRGRELQFAKSGIMPASDYDETVREEWMVDPGKFDFLSNIKSGQPARSRGFQPDGIVTGEAIVIQRKDPKIQAEIDSIMQAHEDARGPSLMELHRQKKSQDAAQAMGKKGDTKFQWSREKDLDAGRRVDKANLNMVLGGAGSDLKKKFHGGI
jgi:hypothetical protein